MYSIRFTPKGGSRTLRNLAKVRKAGGLISGDDVIQGTGDYGQSSVLRDPKRLRPIRNPDNPDFPFR